MRAAQNKLYVNINTGAIYHKPVQVNGVDFEIKKKFYEISEAQAARLEKGEALGEVIREGIEAKITAEVEKTVEKKMPAALVTGDKKNVVVDKRSSGPLCLKQT